MKKESVWSKVCFVFKEEIGEKTGTCLLLYFFLVSMLELLAYGKEGIFSFLASRLWLITAVVLFILFCGSVVNMMYEDIRNKRYFPVAGYLCMLGFLLFFVGNIGYGDINADATQQVGAGLNSFFVPDWNYTGVAFLGYANRQYLLNAIPALLFGRSIRALHMGFAGLFLIGLSMLYMEFKAQLKRYELNESLALVPCYAVLAFRFIGEYYLNFEQAITPVALTMIGIALFLRLCRKMDFVTVVALTWVGCFCCDSYTPAIASLGLLVCFLVLHGIDIYRKHRENRSPGKATKERRDTFLRIQVLFGSVGTLCSFFIATLMGTRQDRLNSVREDMNPLSMAKDVWISFFSDEHAVFFGVFLGIVLLYLIFALTGKLKFYDFVVGVWVLGVVLFAELLEGYTAYEKAWILQRNMIIIPVLVTAIFLWIVRGFVQYRVQVSRKYIASILLLLGIIVTGNFKEEHQSFVYFRYVQPMKYMIACAEELLEEKGISDESEINIVLVTDSVLQSNIYDYAAFFYPNANTYAITSTAELPDMDWDRRTFVFAESEVVLRRLTIDDAESRTYNNVRYKTEIIWYYGEINQAMSLQMF